MSAEPTKDPAALVQECLKELEDRGFLVKQSFDSPEETMYEVHELKEGLRNFIRMKLAESGKPTQFDAINLWVSQQYGGFYTKEF
jgi:hypothetical protein